MNHISQAIQEHILNLLSHHQYQVNGRDLGEIDANKKIKTQTGGLFSLRRILVFMHGYMYDLHLSYINKDAQHRYNQFIILRDSTLIGCTVHILEYTDPLLLDKLERLIGQESLL